MSTFLAAVFVIVLTAIMVSAIYLRKYCREKTCTRRYTIEFAHEGQSWRVVLHKSRLGMLMYAFAKVYPTSPLYFQPQTSMLIKSNGKKRSNLCLITKNDKPIMHLAITFKNLQMANSFIKHLSGMSFADLHIERTNNKILMRWSL